MNFSFRLMLDSGRFSLNFGSVAGFGWVSLMLNTAFGCFFINFLGGFGFREAGDRKF